MYRLAYVSTASKAITALDVQDILEAAIRRNGDCGVAGTLLFNGVNFLQVLEGPEDAVTETYSRICDDRRHNHVVTIFREAGVKRCFDTSPMTLNTVESDTGALPDGLTHSSSIDLFIPNALPGHVRSMLKSFNTVKA